jgi:hypothetical protein
MVTQVWELTDQMYIAPPLMVNRADCPVFPVKSVQLPRRREKTNCGLQPERIFRAKLGTLYVASH